VESHRFAVAALVLVPVFMLAGCGRATAPRGPDTDPNVSATTAKTAGSRTTLTPTTMNPPPVVATSPTTPPRRISGFLAQSVSFVTVDEGFVLGDVACPANECLALRQTTNRGATWTAMTPPPPVLGESNYSAGPELHFADALNGWAYGATLWATHDGANTWHEVNLGGTVFAMASGAGEVYALVEPCDSSASSCDGSGGLYRSPAGQDSWSQVPGVSGQFAAGQYGLVVEGRSVFVATAYPKPELLTSSDGSHFVSLSVPCESATDNGLGPFTIAAIAASDPADLAVLCVGTPSMGGQAERAYLSHNGGYAFQSLPDPAAGFGGALAMPNPTTLLLAGGLAGSTWLYRISGGTTLWSEAAEFGDQGAGLSDLAFVDPTHGAFVHGPASSAHPLLDLASPPSGLGEVYLTNDAGSSWYTSHIPA
jgi:hypothetical protein